MVREQWWDFIQNQSFFFLSLVHALVGSLSHSLTFFSFSICCSLSLKILKGTRREKIGIQRKGNLDLYEQKKTQKKVKQSRVTPLLLLNPKSRNENYNKFTDCIPRKTVIVLDMKRENCEKKKWVLTFLVLGVLLWSKTHATLSFFLPQISLIKGLSSKRSKACCSVSHKYTN